MSHSNHIPAKKNPFKKEKLPDLPTVDFIAAKEIDFTIHSTAQKVKFGDHEFLQCREGYILSYITGYANEKLQKYYYGVFYGLNHPLNSYGNVNGLTKMDHLNQFAALRVLETFPNIENKKLCICTDSNITMRMLNHMETYYENGFRSVRNGEFLQNKATYEAVNKVMRLRNDLELRVLHTTKVCGQMTQALSFVRSAIRASRYDD
ncbi:hypothetical protein Bhyg_06147 [Pseudolycoriella hygida]|uniref:Uncharacterized protein n=1 Tax=Pseudolycoriella hygida TaxID=35572 RepID=A0A9Q0N032_9DIPT|nr:hypothetical protein Bhyg_06147 [Pseudolycoriella hygida]